MKTRNLLFSIGLIALPTSSTLAHANDTWLGNVHVVGEERERHWEFAFQG